MLLAAISAACAPRVSLRVPSDAVAELPLERRLTLLDAENELLAADDRIDAAQIALEEEAGRRDQAKERLRLSREHAADAGGEAALHESEARLTFCEREIDEQRAQLRIAEAALLVAQARFEESRAAEVEAAGLPGSRSVHRDEFHAQVERLAAAQAEVEKKSEPVRAAAGEAEQRWREARAELLRLTGGAQGSVWVQ